MFLLLTFNRPRPIRVFWLLAFLLTLSRYFCVSIEKSNFLPKQTKLPVSFFIFERKVICIAHNTDHPLLCCVFHLTFSLPVTCSVSHNTNQFLVNGESKHCLQKALSKEYLTSFLMISRLIDFAFVVLQLLMFKVCGIIELSKNEFFDFSGTERVKQNKNKIKKPSIFLFFSLKI